MPSSQLTLFAYGTLKRGFRNHVRYCAGYTHCEPAKLVGHLYLHQCGQYPMLVIPEQHILAHGTDNLPADIERADKLKPTDFVSPDDPAWDLIEGELLTFPDGPARLKSIDHLEGFLPDGSGDYLRVLVQLTVPKNRIAWTYIASPTWSTGNRKRLGNRFESSQKAERGIER